VVAEEEAVHAFMMRRGVDIKCKAFFELDFA
jgi:hypothetical protein